MRKLLKFLAYLIIIPDAALTLFLLLGLMAEHGSDEEFLIAFIVGIPTWIWLLVLSNKKSKKKDNEDKQQEEAYPAPQYHYPPTHYAPTQYIHSEYAPKEGWVPAVKTREDYVCAFDGLITYQDFERLAHKCAKHIRRLTIEVSGPVISGEVESQSGISTWQFTIDFNDYGKITGKSWITDTENEDSNIPDRFSELMDKEITYILNGHGSI